MSETKQFTTFWGDIGAKNVTAAKEKPEATADELAEEQRLADLAEEEAENAKNPDDNDDGVDELKPGDEGYVDPEEEEEEEEENPEGAEEEELSEEEETIQNAYTMLLDEGVLKEEEADDFELTPAGMADKIAASIRDGIQEELTNTPDSVRAYYNHVMGGGDESSFTYQQTTNWAEVNIEDSIENQKVAFKQHLINTGVSEADATEEVAEAEENGRLEKKATVAKAALIKQDETQATARAAAKTATDKTAAEKVSKEVDKIEKFIDTATEIAGFKLDDKKRKAFKKYIFHKNPRSGKTQMDENMTNEDRRMTVAFLDFVNFTKADLTKEVAAGLTKARKKKLSRHTSTGMASTNSSKSLKTKTASTGKLKIPSFFGVKTEAED